MKLTLTEALARLKSEVSLDIKLSNQLILYHLKTRGLEIKKETSKHGIKVMITEDEYLFVKDLLVAQMNARKRELSRKQLMIQRKNRKAYQQRKLEEEIAGLVKERRRKRAEKVEIEIPVIKVRDDRVRFLVEGEKIEGILIGEHLDLYTIRTKDKIYDRVNINRIEKSKQELDEMLKSIKKDVD